MQFTSSVKLGDIIELYNDYNTCGSHIDYKPEVVLQIAIGLGLMNIEKGNEGEKNEDAKKTTNLNEEENEPRRLWRCQETEAKLFSKNEILIYATNKVFFKKHTTEINPPLKLKRISY